MCVLEVTYQHFLNLMISTSSGIGEMQEHPPQRMRYITLCLLWLGFGMMSRWTFDGLRNQMLKLKLLFVSLN